MLKRLLGVLLLLAAPLSLSAGTTGKIAGKVIDKETGDPLPGANVTVVGTTLGGATDINGDFFVLNVPPGTYELEASFIGYNKTRIKNVRVVADLTQELNFALVAEALAAEELVIIAERPVFEKNATNTVRVVDSEELSKLPVRGASSAVALQAGVVSAEGSGGVDNNATVNIRGGRGNETAYYVDGVLQNDILFGSNSGQISNEAIEQVSMQVGGFDAKYGNAQSGVINVTTKRGADRYQYGAEVVTSEATDDYGYNIYNVSMAGPLLPGNTNHSFFALYERNYFADGNPTAISTRIRSVGIDSPTLLNNASDLHRWTVKTTHNFGSNFRMVLTGNGSMRNARGYTHSYAKNNSHHNPLTKDDNYAYSLRGTYTIGANSFLNVTAISRRIDNTNGDGVFFDDVEAYGDPTKNQELADAGLQAGERVGRDPVNVFFDKGRVSNGFTKYQVFNNGLNADFTSQIGKHLLEVGAAYTQYKLRYWGIAPVGLASAQGTDEERYLAQSVGATYYGFTPTGKKNDDTAKEPIEASFYVQDKIELGDLVLNLGARLDYWDAKGEQLRDRANPYGFGNDQEFDDADFVANESEVFISPRIGIGFPVSDNTIFHAQYGRFVQHPRLIDMYWSRNRFNRLLNDDNFTILVGDLESEQTIQYEAGLRKTIGDKVAVDATLFYKDVKGLVNRTQVRFQKGASEGIYLTNTNTDFGTVKGIALKVDVRRTNYVALAFDYTLSLAEGTGSSQGSSAIAAFRNPDGDIPKVTAPLNFDQRHTLTANLDFRVPEGEAGLLGGFGANALVTLNSGRPYTPLELQNVLASATNFGDTRGYVNSAYGPGSFRIDLKIDRRFEMGRMSLLPYLEIQNLTDRDNVLTVFRSNGDEFTTGWLQTAEGKAAVAGAADPDTFISDYGDFERNPGRFGIPRQVRLGLKVNFR